jgi:hypothetical protein
MDFKPFSFSGQLPFNTQPQPQFTPPSGQLPLNTRPQTKPNLYLLTNKYVLAQVPRSFSCFFSFRISTMNDDAKIVIRGVLDKIEDENISENKAPLISSALNKLCGGVWNVITYTTYTSEAGYTDSNFHWRNKEWVYAEQTTSIDHNASNIKAFMDTEFGWATIKDINAVQQSAYTKINNKFPGTWRVHVVQLQNGGFYSICGTDWQSDSFTFYIYRVA